MNFYNENDEYTAQWLRNLIGRGLIPYGKVDERDIRDIKASDLEGYTQCHFFAGIAGWSRALELAGWPEDLEVWTGSCPCQPFSLAGKQKGVKDERHLWPVWYELIKKCRPTVCFGEQTTSPAGREWLSGVRADLEELGYVVGGADLCASSVNSPQIRQRLWWVAIKGVANSEASFRGRSSLEANTGRGFEKIGGSGIVNRMGYSCGKGGRWNTRSVSGEKEESSTSREEIGGKLNQFESTGFWGEFSIVRCADGKSRRIESGNEPLAYGVPARVGKLSAYGNAIVPQVAAEFIIAFREALVELMR
jgi:DNA (cytosine-5)-methyltransferase 1